MLRWNRDNYFRHHRLLTISMVCFTACFPLASHAKDAFSIDQAEPWVEVAPSPAPNKQAKELARDGVYYRLYDRQINAVDAQNPSKYKAIEIRLTNRSGVRNRSQIEIELDTSYEHAIIHELGVIRDGQFIDKLQSTQIEQLRSEDQLSSLIYNGTTTLSAILSDVRVNDVIRYAYTIEGSNPVFEDLIEYSSALQHYINMERTSFALHVDVNSTTHVRKHDTPADFKLVQTESEGIRTYRWSADQIGLLNYEENEPTWTKHDPYFTISSIEDWGDIVEWMLPHYNKASVQNAELASVANTINQRHATTEAKIAEALRWVQDEIRYFGIELGANSHNPSPVDVTLERRFGDCKDKTVLLIALLGELGIDAQPALVNTKQSLRNEDYIYRLHAFDHVIVHLEHNGKSHWLDPTDDYQLGDLGDFYEPDFSHALIIDKGQESLTPMNAGSNHYTVQVTKHISISKDNINDATLSVHTVREGQSAEYFRRRLSNISKVELLDDYVDYYRYYYNQLDSSTPVSNTEMPKNKSVSTEKYTISELWDRDDNGDAYFPIYADDIRGYLDLPDTPRYRTRPYQINHPISLSETSVIQLTNNLLPDHAAETIDNKYFTLSVDVVQDETWNRVSFTYHYETHASMVKPEDMKDYQKAIERARELTYFDIYPHGLGWAEQAETVSNASYVDVKQ